LGDVDDALRGRVVMVVAVVVVVVAVGGVAGVAVVVLAVVVVVVNLGGSREGWCRCGGDGRPSVWESSSSWC